jgi:hypothetical protein
MQGDLSHGSGSYRQLSWHGMQGGDEGHPCQGGVTALVSGWLLLPGWFVRSHGWLSGRGRVGNRYACFYHEPKIKYIETQGNLSHRIGSDHEIRRWLRAWGFVCRCWPHATAMELWRAAWWRVSARTATQRYSYPPCCLTHGQPQRRHVPELVPGAVRPSVPWCCHDKNRRSNG